MKMSHEVVGQAVPTFFLCFYFQLILFLTIYVDIKQSLCLMVEMMNRQCPCPAQQQDFTRTP